MLKRRKYRCLSLKEAWCIVNIYAQALTKPWLEHCKYRCPSLEEAWRIVNIDAPALKKARATQISMPQQLMTWRAFERHVLERAGTNWNELGRAWTRWNALGRTLGRSEASLDAF